jgi:hypothetical protein
MRNRAKARYPKRVCFTGAFVERAAARNYHQGEGSSPPSRSARIFAQGNRSSALEATAGTLPSLPHCPYATGSLNQVADCFTAHLKAVIR